MEKQIKYYLGLDIGTDSVGYAAVNSAYQLRKFHGEPVWGVTTFDAASLAEDRRKNRVNRRRYDRCQQRVQLLEELFAPEICKMDPHFFIRRKESGLFAEDSQFGVQLFDGGITDKEYHQQFPTIHHLICHLMQSETPSDIRLVFLACAWLVANRGHFLSDASMDAAKGFQKPYQDFAAYLYQDCECSLPWRETVSPDTILAVMQEKTGVKRKTALFIEKVYEGRKLAKQVTEDFPFRKDLIINLLCGGEVKPKDLFANEAYAECDSVSLGMDDVTFAERLAPLGEDGVLLRLMRGMYDCAVLNQTLDGHDSISEAKVAVYDQHAKDLTFPKYIVRKYKPSEYGRIFRRAEVGNYTAYSNNTKNCPQPQSVKRADKKTFCDFLKKIVKDISVTAEDHAGYEDMCCRLEEYRFLPKQKDGDNRVIPQQLYQMELLAILKKAKAYLPMLSQRDESGISNAEKIHAIFTFKIPYYVGPLNPQSKNAWLERKPGKIYPWNFESMVDLDASEEGFIRRMTNKCTYLPGEDVLPFCSLLYSRFMVLNALNNLKINQNSIPVSVKQVIFQDVYQGSSKKITLKTIEKYLRSNGLMQPEDVLSGMDGDTNVSLKVYHSFRRLLESGSLTEAQVEDIITHAAYSEDKKRMGRYLEKTFPALSKEDRAYILRLNLKAFGRLSRRLLDGIVGCAVSGSGEAMTVIQALWETNDNLMQLLSDRYTFRDAIEHDTKEYYSDPAHHRTLSQRLSDMYVSNAVKRPIIRTLDITADVVKAMGGAPQKIFVEMARGSTPDQKGKRTKSRRMQLLELYQAVKNEDTARLLKELEAMGELADNRLQSDKLFLYYLQLGRCAYSGQPIELSQLATKTYDIDHIYPQSKVQDDSIRNNKVLVLSTENGAKGDVYPVAAAVQSKMGGFWKLLKDHGLMTEEKYRRLTRTTGFTDEELHQFINRQLVETRQSTKVVAQLLKERYPETEIVYVKAGMVSQFRQEFDMLKCRSVNDLHHAKDAYLNIVVGNVYHERFTRRWFDTNQKYNISVQKIFEHEQRSGGEIVWHGQADLALVRKTMGKNAVHLTRYAFCRKHGQSGGLFNQQLEKAAKGLIPRKAGMPTEKYGGYNNPTASFYLLASFRIKKKKDIMFVPVELRDAERVLVDSTFAAQYTADMISAINGGKEVSDIRILLNGRPVKINTVLSLDGMLVTVRGKTTGGKQMIISEQLPLLVDHDTERYVKRLESFLEKKKTNPKLQLDAQRDQITREANNALYALLYQKMTQTVFQKCPGNIGSTLQTGQQTFEALELEEQVKCLMNIIGWFHHANNVDISSIGGKKSSGAKQKSANLSAWRANYQDVQIIDQSASGLFASSSENLLALL